MSLRRKFERKIRDKDQEIQHLERSLIEAKAYLQAMQDAIRLIPAEGSAENGEASSEMVVRPGSAMEAAVKALRDSGSPMHIMDLLKAMGKEPSPENRSSVGSQLAAYVRKGFLITRPAPNTFGLSEWGSTSDTDGGPPDDFGSKLIDNA